LFGLLTQCTAFMVLQGRGIQQKTVPGCFPTCKPPPTHILPASETGNASVMVILGADARIVARLPVPLLRKPDPGDALVASAAFDDRDADHPQDTDDYDFFEYFDAEQF
jgi:hypothetical protein